MLMTSPKFIAFDKPDPKRERMMFWRSLAAIGLLGACFALASLVKLAAAYFFVVAALAVVSFWAFPRFSVCFLLASVFFQYFWIGVFFTQFDSFSTIRCITLGNAVVIYTIFLSSVVYLLMHWRELPVSARNLLWTAAAFTVVILAFFIVGWVRSSLGSAFYYLKSYSGIMLFLVIGCAYGIRLDAREILGIAAGFGVIMATYGYLEFLFPYQTYSFVHMTEWLSYKHAGYMGREDLVFTTIQDAVDYFTVSFLNLSGAFKLDLAMIRPAGPMFHFISFAYAMAFCFIAALVGNRLWTAIYMFLMLVLIASKGAMILALFAILAFILLKLSDRQHQLYACVLVALGCYIVLVLFYGYHTNDYHFLGIQAGIKGFIGNPIGQGLGIGGNASSEISTIKRSGIEFSNAKGLVAESALVVLLYQTGILGFLLLTLVWKQMVSATLSLAGARDGFSLGAKNFIICVVLSTLYANSIFQEEVFSPHALGVWLVITGAILSEKSTKKENARLRFAKPNFISRETCFGLQRGN